MNETIIKVTEAGQTTFVQADKPEQPVIDKFALQKLLQSKPPEKPKKRKRVTHIRCNRSIKNSWATFKPGVLAKLFDCGILANASLSSRSTPALGCGGISDWIGMASGEMVSKGDLVSVPAELVRRLYFDSDQGSFHDRLTHEEITECDYLILKPDCHAEYIPKTNGEPKTKGKNESENRS